jgi:hypothetical protein
MLVIAANEPCLVEAMDAETGHGLAFWDACCGPPPSPSHPLAVVVGFVAFPVR